MRPLTGWEVFGYRDRVDIDMLFAICLPSLASFVCLYWHYLCRRLDSMHQEYNTF